MAGGCPQKYVTGALVEGEIAGKAAIEEINSDEKNNVILSKAEEDLLIK